MIMAQNKPFFERFGLNAREQRLAQMLAVVAAGILLLGLPIGLESWVASKRSGNGELREALEAVQASRADMRASQAKRDAITNRYARKAPELGGYLEQMARKQKLEVTDSVDRPPLPIGKSYTERSTTIHLKKAGLLAISRFMESLEQSGSPVAINRLNLRRRTGEQDSYDVELGVSAYDRNEKPAGSKAAGASSASSSSTKETNK
jgi:general secretion pathway protein M